MLFLCHILQLLPIKFHVASTNVRQIICKHRITNWTSPLLSIMALISTRLLIVQLDTWVLPIGVLYWVQRNYQNNWRETRSNHFWICVFMMLALWTTHPSPNLGVGLKKRNHITPAYLSNRLSPFVRCFKGTTGTTAVIVYPLYPLCLDS